MIPFPALFICIIKQYLLLTWGHHHTLFSLGFVSLLYKILLKWCFLVRYCLILLFWKRNTIPNKIWKALESANLHRANNLLSSMHFLFCLCKVLLLLQRSQTFNKIVKCFGSSSGTLHIWWSFFNIHTYWSVIDMSIRFLQ